jgi:hypothetical protein
MSEPHRPLAELLDTVEAMVRRYVVLREEACTATALWIVHTHVVEAFETTPYLAVMSAEKRSGKTRLLDVMEGLVARPWRTVRPSEAVTFRKIEATQPALLLDEIDTVFREKKGDTSMEGLRALLNAGNRRGTCVDRCTGKNFETLRSFNVFCAKAIAGIGRLPDTVADRSILIDMVRKTSAEAVAKFRFRDFKIEAAALRDNLAAWAEETVGTLGTMTATVPETLNDRAAEAWEPLLLLADVAGGRWPDRTEGRPVLGRGRGPRREPWSRGAPRDQGGVRGDAGRKDADGRSPLRARESRR